MGDRITINDPWLGEREIENSPVALIRDQHRLLCYFRDDGRLPSQELLDDIAAYASILDAPDAERRAEEYLEAAGASADPRERPRPREVARAKGWMP